MNSKFFYIILFLYSFCLFTNCSKKNVVESPHYNENIVIINESEINKNRIENNDLTEKQSIIDFYYTEIMNGFKDLDFHRDEYKIIQYFGEPLEIKIESISFSMLGGTATEIHYYIYNDFTHYYYIFDNDAILYIGFFIENKLDRLKTINIGDSYEKLLTTFKDKYNTWEEVESIKENISYYTNIGDIQFYIKNGIILKIYVKYLYDY